MVLPTGAIIWGLEPPPRRHADQGYLGFALEMREMVQSEEVRQAEIAEEDVFLGDIPALKIVVKISGEVEPGSGVVLTMYMVAVVEKTPQLDGRYRMLNIMLTESMFEQMPGLIEHVVASVDVETPPPFELSALFSYAGEHRAGNTRPVLAADGFSAIGHIFNNTIKVFDAQGRPHAEWDLYAHFPDGHEGKLLAALDLDFLADGAIAALFSYYRMGAEILVFERDGSLRTRLPATGPQAQEGQRFDPSQLRVGYEGQYVVIGSIFSEGAGSTGRPLYLDTFTPDGTHRSRLLPKLTTGREGGGVAALPGDRLALLLAGDGDLGERGSIAVLEASGEISRHWGPDGVATLTEQEPEQDAEFHGIAGSDRSGRLYLNTWRELRVFDAEGNLLDVLPQQTFPFRRSDGLTISPLGDLLAAIRPQHLATMETSGLEVTQPSLIVMRYRHALPDDSPVAAPVSVPEESSRILPEVASESLSALAATQFDSQLLALTTEGRLTVRALRAFNALPEDVDALALFYRRHELDLFGADAAQIARWRDREEGPALSDNQQAQLERLHQRMAEVLDVASQRDAAER